jgi:dUTP pyrophosphatase
VSDSVEVLVTGAVAPFIAHPGDAGADLSSSEGITLEPGQRATVSTGLKMALPNGYAAFVVPRSGLAAKHGITVVNSPGTVDAGYRGEIKVTLLNTDSSQAFEINIGDRIAQLIVMPVVSPRFIEVATLPESHRGEGGFGSTGIHTSTSEARS